MSEEKKPYTPPTVTDHGKVEKETRGIVSIAWEVYGHQPTNDAN